MEHNLVEEPWLPVELGGRTDLVSLRDALVRAHEIEDVVPPRPTHAPALLRHLLLPVLIDASGIPASTEDWTRRWRAGRVDQQAVDDYLEKYRDRFDLFHHKRPFAQVAGLATAKGETKPSSLLIPHIAVGNNVPLFSPRTEPEAPALTAGEALMWLLHTHCWDTAAIKTGAVGDPRVKAGKTTGNPTGPLGELGVTVLGGRTLFETLMLNTPIVPDGLPPGDRPQWRGPPATPRWEERSPVGLLDLLTWQARRIRLIPSQGAHGLEVREVIVAAGDRMDLDTDLEPHTTWTQDLRAKEGPSRWRPRRHRAGRSAWQGLDALVAIDPAPDAGFVTSSLLRQVGELVDVVGEDYPLTVFMVGMVYGSQSAVVEHVIVDTLPLPVAALRATDEGLREATRQLADQADAVGRALNALAGDVRRSMGGQPLPWDRGQRLDVEFLHLVDPHVRGLLTELQAAPDLYDEAQSRWQRVANRVAFELADRLLDGLPPSAFGGRKHEQRKAVYRPANAEQRFRRTLKEVLPDAYREVDTAQDPGEET